MNILTIEEIIGLDNTIYKGKYINAARNYWGTAINYDYFLNNPINKLGVIHYTNNSVSNFYAEGFYKNTLTLKIPYLMWHKKQFGGVGLANDIGYTFVCGTELKSIGVNNSIHYYDLIDQEIKTILVAKSTKRKSDRIPKRAVRCVNTGLVYASSRDASDILSFEGIAVEPRSILYVCQGKQRMAGGLKWEYADTDLLGMTSNLIHAENREEN